MLRTFLLVTQLSLGASFQTAANLHHYSWPPFMVLCDAADSTLAQSLPAILAPVLADLDADLQMQSSTEYTILIAPDHRFYQNYLTTGLPAWSGAFALPQQRLLVVKSPRWDRPENNLQKALIHELVHLALYDRTDHQQLPRWLEEGLALFYESPRDWDYPVILSKALYTRSLIPLSEIDEVLSFQKSRADLAYQESYSATAYFLSVYDVDGLRVLLDGFKQKQPVNDNFIKATGSSFPVFEKEWQAFIQKNYNYSWLSELESLLWLFILLLSIWAFFWIRHRNRKILQRWSTAIPEQDLMMPDAQKNEAPSASPESFIEKDDADA